MNKAKVIEGVCQMRFEDIYDRHEQKRLTCEEAAELLGISIKTFYRKRQRYEEEDFNGVFDRRIGKASSHRAAGSEVTSLIRLYSERYRGFSVKHFHEFAIREEGVKRSYSWTKNKLLEKGLIQKTLLTLYSHWIYHKDSILVIEHDRREPIPEVVEGWILTRQRKIGNTVISFLTPRLSSDNEGTVEI